MTANGKSNVLISVKENIKKGIDMNLYPNPATTELNIYIDNYKLNINNYIDIIDLQGKLVKHIENISNEMTILIYDLQKGNYILNLMDFNKKIISKSFIVE